MFREVDIHTLGMNPFEAIGNQWMLITAGNEESLNTMTASWGGLGVIWNMDCATCYIRPQRYTLEFVEREDYFTLTFFGEEYRKALALCGRVSGRDCDKIAQAGLTPVFGEDAPYFDEAQLVLVCRKIYRGNIEPQGILCEEGHAQYPNNDHHIVYMGQIVKCLVRED